MQLTGFVAWLLWRTIYLMKLPGVVRRLRVALDWTLDLFFPRDITQLQVFAADRLEVHHYEPGEIIVAQGRDRPRALHDQRRLGRGLRRRDGGRAPSSTRSARGTSSASGRCSRTPSAAPRCARRAPVDVLVMSRA